MKIKSVNKITVEMAAWERQRLIDEIGRVTDAWQSGDGVYPLALHDFREDLLKSQREEDS